MVVLVPGLLALAFGWFAFRSRVTGVYLSIITQGDDLCLCLAEGVLSQRFSGFGGNNGLTDFGICSAFPFNPPRPRPRYFRPAPSPSSSPMRCQRGDHRPRNTAPRAGRGARRGVESRMRFLGYRVENYKLFVFVVSAIIAGIAGALCDAAGRHHQSERIRARELDRSSDLGRGRGSRDTDRRGARRNRCQLRENLFHRRVPQNIGSMVSACCSS